MMFYAIIRDDWQPCVGHTQLGPYATRKEATWAAEYEVKAAAELFTDGRANLTTEIVQR